MSGPWRFGSGSDRIDLPGVAGDLPVSYVEQGGSTRAIDGTLLRQRIGAVKRQWDLTFRPWADATQWQGFQRMYLASPGPYELYDPTVPNMLPIAIRLGSGWVQADGTAIAASADMRLSLSSPVSAAQTAKSTNPDVSTLFAVTEGTQYTAAITVDVVFAGSLSVYGYAAAPSGSGTLQGAASTFTTAGRVSVTFTAGSGIAFVALQVARTSGSGKVVDPSLFPAAADAGRGVRTVAIQSAAETANLMEDGSQTPNLSSWTATLEEV